MSKSEDKQGQHSSSDEIVERRRHSKLSSVNLQLLNLYGYRMIIYIYIYIYKKKVNEREREVYVLSSKLLESHRLSLLRQFLQFSPLEEYLI